MQRTIRFEGRRVSYEFHHTYQQGTPLVLLHGLCEDSTLWHSNLLTLERPILTIDLPGFGKSEPPAVAALSSYSASVKQIMDTENIEKCVMLGHSMGGYVTLDFAAKFPHQLQGLGLLHSHPYADSETVRENRRRTIQLIQDGKYELYLSQFFPQLFDPRFAATHPIVIQSLILRAKTFPQEGIISAHQSMLARADHQHTLAQLDVPVLIIIGKSDPLLSSELAQNMTALPQLADIHMLENVGHVGMLEVPELFTRLVSDFIEWIESR